MRRAFLMSTVAISVATSCVAWEDDDATPTAQCTPPTANDVDVTLSVTGAEAFAGNPASARFVLGTQVLSCTSTMVPAGGSFELLLDGFGPMGGATVELVLSSDANPAHTGGDLTQTFLIDQDG